MSDDRKICGSCKWCWKEFGYWVCRNRYSENYDKEVWYEHSCRKHDFREGQSPPVISIPVGGDVPRDTVTKAITIDKNSIICGRCKWIESHDGSWRCSNPNSDMSGQKVSYPDVGCEAFENFRNAEDSEKKSSVSEDLLRKVQAFLDKEWIPEEELVERSPSAMMEAYPESDKRIVRKNAYAAPEILADIGESAIVTDDFDDVIGVVGQTFQEKLLSIIDEKGLKDSDVYNRANIDRRLFSKIRSNKNYKPSKATALAFAIALRLNQDETTDLLQRAGLALSPSSKADLIVKYCITNRIYNIYDVNAILYEYDQPLLGY